jgi:hypothetical protein
MKKVRYYAKQLPLFLLALVALGWAASLFASFGWVFSAGTGKQLAIRCESGSLRVSKSVRYERSTGPYWQAASTEPSLASSFGKLDYGRIVTAGWLVVPFPILLMVLLPLWIGPRLKFRFQPSHLLAYSGSLAGLLAFYLVSRT